MRQNAGSTLLYMVQRCWHSGPHQYQPLDYLRLFTTQREAEEAAYHSARAWMRAHNHGRDVSIKTLLLPSYPAHNNPQGSSYGFIAQGSLFWVRALTATIVTDGTVDGSGRSDTNICRSLAYAVLTEGVVGGTGNRNSRRGTEVCQGRLFGGDASAHLLAQQAAEQLNQQFVLDGRPQIQVSVATLPVGKPAEYASSQFLSDWPQQVLHAPVLMEGGGGRNAEPTKRGALESLEAWNMMGAPLNHHDHQQRQEQYVGLDEGMVVDCPFEVPDLKRRKISPSPGVNDHH